MDSRARIKESGIVAALAVWAVFSMLAIVALAGYSQDSQCDAAPYIERCRIVRQHAIDESESPVPTKALVLTADFIEQVKTPGFHGEMPQ